jgi:class 3 adenylate cyclase/tetratricopeptide (TPR) repeat protein
MHCGSCGTELLAGKKFCHACGARAALQCRGCGATIAPDFRFCPDCGLEIGATVHDGVPPPADDPMERLSEHMPAALAHKILETRGAIEGERKQVTVLFCDLVGSTAIAERLDPEEYHDLLDRYLELAFAEIYRLDGIVNQLAGDGLMALFGAPVAHEDAPQRAVLAALAIHEALARFAPDTTPALRARIGIHTGPVVVGTVGNDLKMDYTAIGDTTNLAARLEALAEPGTTLVSDATSRLVRGFFQLRPVGPLAVKGKSEPVMANAVIGAAEVTTPMAIAAERGMTPFVGRVEELAQLEAAYRRIAGRVAQVVAVVGPAGAGKSRLIYEFRQRLGDGEALVLEGRCSSLGQNVPYLPFVTMFRHYFGLVPGDTPETASAKVAAKVEAWRERPDLLAGLVARLLALPIEGRGEPEAEAMKREAYDAVAQLLLAESERVPVLLAIEDLHCIDDESRQLLETLVARLTAARVMVVVSQRPEDQPAWRALAAFTQIVLPRLSDDEVCTMIRTVAGGTLPPELERLLVARAEGSPFFAEEITRALVEEGYLVREHGRRRLSRPLEDVRIPGTVQEVIAARLDRLSPQAKRVVQVAAVLGRQFRGGQLATLLGGEGIDVSRELADLERRGLFHRKHLLGSDEFRFGESLTQEVAYEGLLLKQRRQLHERVALQLEASADEPSVERTALLAHHFARSDNRPKAIEALLHAGQEAERVPSYRAALELYRQAWSLCDAAGDGDPAIVRATLAATSGFARLTVLYGLPFLADAERAAERGRAIAEALGDAQELSSLCYFQGVLIMSRGRDHFARGLEVGEQGLAVAERAGLVIQAMRLSRGLCVNYALDGRFELASRTMAWMVEELERMGAREQYADLYVSACWVRDIVRYLSDDLDGALESAAATHDFARRIPNRTVRSGAAGTMAQINFLRGDYAEAKRWADECLEISEKIANPAGFPAAAAVGLAARIELGEPVAPGRYVELIDQGMIAGGGAQLNIRFVTEALLAVGDRARLERHLDELRDQAGGRLRDALVSVSLGDVLARLERYDEADRRYHEALALADALGARSVVAAAALGAAEVAAARGDDAASARHLERALGIARSLRLGRYEARATRLRDPRRAAAAEG